MAEIFGIVAGALSVAALFDNCVDSFEYIQLGRHFGRDFERCQLKLDVARIRLGRWGSAVKINKDPRFDIVTPLDKKSQNVRAILEEIKQLFQVVQKSSKRYGINVGDPPSGPPCFGPPVNQFAQINPFNLMPSF
ncbi:hypothetical protein PG997_000113 [Apiospora hydei]|uniref:Prion-inhibition and propagation HeLo domain-containing protein n=1 Tax=Apiospora hydei TaxID=1337664 RepID=A0ABR1X9T8_9PEZI